MLTDGHATNRGLARLLLERLRPLASRMDALEPSQVRMRGPRLFGYCCVMRERLTRISTQKPRIGIVLSGEKEFWLGDSGQHFSAGDVFALPAGVEFDVVNIPSDANGLYESVLVEIDHIPAALRGHAVRVRQPRGFDLRIPLTAELVDALSHAAILLGASDHATALAEHRLTEVLMLLARVPVAACLFSRPLGERIAWLVMADPMKRWTAESLGRELGLAGSTLRRKLTEQGISLRDTLAMARMTVAHRVLQEGTGSITEAAAAAGYASRSHFARRFRQVYGTPPAAVRPLNSAST